MKKKRDKLNIPGETPDGEEIQISLEEILAEYGRKQEVPAEEPEAPPAPSVSPPRVSVRAPEAPPEPEPAPEPEAKPAPKPTPPPSPKQAPKPEPAPVCKPEPEPKPKPVPVPVLSERDREQEEELQPPEITEETTEDDPDSVYAGFRRLIRDADNYASQMYEDGYEEQEQAEEDEAEEDVFAAENWWPFRRRRRDSEPEPDVPPDEMAQEYSKGLKSLRIRSYFMLVFCLLLCYMIFADHFSLPLPALITAQEQLPLQVMLGLHLAVILLAVDVIAAGIAQFFTLRVGMEALVTLSCLASLGDGVSRLFGLERGDMLPFCAVSAAALYFAVLGIRQRRLALRIACKCAASSSACYTVTGDPDKWSGHAAFTKHTGTLDGFTAAMHAPDCVQRIYFKLSPLLILAAVLFGVMASVGRDRPVYFLWNFSAVLAARPRFPYFSAFPSPFWS
jgi:hypothetical protein